MDIYNSLNISIGTVMKNTEMLKFVLDHLKTKKNCVSMQLKNYLIYVPNRYKTQQMCDRVVNIYFFVFDSIPD